MPGDKQLFEREKGHIEELRRAGLGIRAVARELQKSHHVILNFLRYPNSYGYKKRTGPKPKLSAGDKCRIANAASNSTLNCKEIKKQCDLKFLKLTVWRAIKKIRA